MTGHCYHDLPRRAYPSVVQDALRYLPESLPPENRTKSARRLSIIDLAALRSVGRQPGVRPILLIAFNSIFWFAGVQSIFRLFTLDAFKMNVEHTGRVLGLVGLVSVIVQGGLIGRLNKHFGEIRLLAAALVLMAAGFVLQGLSVNFGVPMFIVAAAVTAAGTSLHMPSVSSYISRRVGADGTGRDLGSHAEYRCPGARHRPAGLGFALRRARPAHAVLYWRRGHRPAPGRDSAPTAAVTRRARRQSPHKLRYSPRLASFVPRFMKSTHLAWLLAFTTLLALVVPARAGEWGGNVNRRTGLFEPPLSDLRKAAEREDHAELARAASRLGPVRLARALADPDPRMVQAALDALPIFSAGILLLGDTLPCLAAADENTRFHAIRAVAALLAANDSSRLEEWEIANETTRAICRALATAATSEGLPVATRLLALQGLGDAGNTCAPSMKPGSLLASPEPEIRRAAVLMSGAKSSATWLTAANDSNSQVAAAAGARLCEVGLQTNVSSILVSHGLRQLALANGAAAEDVVEMLPCLAASADPADAKALVDLRNTASAAIRTAIGRLREKGTAP
jgi:hypothetical protein